MAFSKSKREKNTHPSAKYRSKGETRKLARGAAYAPHTPQPGWDKSR